MTTLAEPAVVTHPCADHLFSFSTTRTPGLRFRAGECAILVAEVAALCEAAGLREGSDAASGGPVVEKAFVG